MHCILTGFDPFGGADVNPSQLAVERVSDTLPIIETEQPAVSISRVVLPTCCNEAWSSVQMHVSQLPNDKRFAVVLSGLAEKRERITVERFALNVRSYRIADNRGHQPDDEHIDSSGPEAIRTTAPIRQIVERLNSCGLACEISDHAGSFVCNETYYRALQRWQSDHRCAGVLFIHFPSPENYARVVCGDSVPESFDPVGEFAKALEESIRCLAEEIEPARERH